MASSLLNKLKLRAGESIDTLDPTDPDNPNQAIIDRYKNVPGVNVEKLTEYVNLNISEPQTIVDAIILAEAVGYTSEQAKVVGAQWVLESGRGVSTAGADYNYFGIKSHNDAVMKRMSEQYGIDVFAGETVSTAENAKDGTRYLVDTSFASFNNPIEGFLGKKAFLETNKRYKEALNPENTADQFAQGLEDAGYATVSDDQGNRIYKKKLASIYNGPMRTTRPDWMKPTRKNNVSQADWTMTGVQPTEGSRADLVTEKKWFEKTSPVVEETIPVVSEPASQPTFNPNLPDIGKPYNLQKVIDKNFSNINKNLSDIAKEEPSFTIGPVINPLTGEEESSDDAILDDITYNPKMPKMIGYADESVNNYLKNKDNYEKLATENAANEASKIPVPDPPQYEIEDVEEEIIPLQKPVQQEINMEYLNSLPDFNSTISPGTFTNESRSKEQLKQDEEALKFIMSPLQRNAKSGYFGSGQSMFYPSTRQQKYGGGMSRKYFENGGSGDPEDPEDPFSTSEISKPTNPINTSKGFFGFLKSAAEYDAARKMSKVELPERGDLSYDNYLQTLNHRQKSSIPFKEEMGKRDVELENYKAAQVRKGIVDIGKKIGDDYGGTNSLGLDRQGQYNYLGVGFMGNENSWFHNIKNNIYASPHTCQGIACAIARKAGAVNASDYKTATAKGTKGDPIAIETGTQTVDHRDVMPAKGYYKVNDIQPADMIRHGNKAGRTYHNTTALSKGIPYYDEAGNVAGYTYDSAYGSNWFDGVMANQYTAVQDEDQSWRYFGNLPQLQEEASEAKTLNSKYQEYLDKRVIANLPIKKAELIRTEPSEIPFIPKKQYPNTRRGRKQEQQDNAYITAYMNRMQKK